MALYESDIIINGMRIHGNATLTTSVQFKFPKHKKKNRRIVKKFRKRYSREEPSKQIYKAGNTLFCHPVMFELVEQALKQNAKL